MTAPIGKMLFAALLLLAGVCAEAALSDSDNHRIASDTPRTSTQNPARPGMMWQILPGEDIRETARLIYPQNSVARNNLIRAIIRTNPQHFPGGSYQPLAAGTIIHFPDLRTIGAYAKTEKKSHKTSPVKKSPKPQPQTTPPLAIVKTDLDPQLTRMIARLDHEAETESHELNTLIQHIGSMEARFREFQTLLEAKNLHAGHSPTIAATEAPSNENSASEPVQETGLIAGEVAPLAEQLNLPPENIGSPTENELLAEVIPPATEPTIAAEAAPHESIAHDEIAPPTQQLGSTQHAPNISAEETPDIALEDMISADNILLIGILLTILIVLIMLRSYRKIKERHAHASDIVTILDSDERRRYEALFLRESENTGQSPENPPAPDDQVIAEARALIAQDKTDEAVQTLQKQLATNQQNIPGWLLLFELLYKANNKRDFKKNARRFKRLNQYPDIWMQIQSLGNKLEPSEPLYFDEQKRKEKFFSDASAAE
ncbi:MAG: hypothetical protein A4S08_09775 [Proteobacteria bacterium SG_bin4]|nr:MAG: hypothetical protein A4S08_09775 [Proteobacteria bacterium SG_bin4]